jgi:hypothetical protein
MARARKLAHGSKVSIGGTAFAMVRKFKPPTISRGKTEITTFDDLVEYFRDTDPPNAGEIEFEAVWDPEDADESVIDNILLNDDPSERDTTVAFQVRKTGTGTPPATSTWTYTTLTYSVRLIESAPVEVDSKTLFARRIKAYLIGLPVKS